MNVFLFPGQGSQEVGMGADLFREDATFQALIRRASECVGEDLSSVCLRGPEQMLARSRVLQPLLVAVSLGYLRRLRERGVKPDLVLGHSLGEVTALAAAEVVTPEEAVHIAAKRGELMETAAASVDGSMLAVTTEQRELVLECSAGVASEGRWVLANDNSPQQIVFSGERKALMEFAAELASRKLGRTKLLSVSGPWHSPFMTGASAAFEDWLTTLTFHPPRVSLLLNMGEREDLPDRIRMHIARALVQPVQWRNCMGHVRAMKPAALFEIGPGRVLAGLARANGLGDEIRVFPVNNLRGVDLAMAATTLINRDA